MTVQFPGSVSLASLPTRIERLDRLTEMLGGPQLFIKRDDQTGCGLSGNKVRKLEYLAADALRQGADTLVTCGLVQSNHARATAIVAARLGLKSFLFLQGEPPDELDGNFFLDELVGAEIRYISPEEYDRVDGMMADMARRWRASGRKPYLIPEGGSNEIGVMGYVQAAQEIQQQAEKDGVDFDYLVTAVSSGGTYAGLQLGARECGLDTQVLGFNIRLTAQDAVDRIFRIVEKVEEIHDVSTDFSRSDIQIVDGYVGLGYGLSRREEIDLIQLVARHEGIILDPVYTAKAMFGLVDQIKKGRFKKGSRILFVHTGGIFGLFPKRRMFSR